MSEDLRIVMSEAQAKYQGKIAEQAARERAQAEEALAKEKQRFEAIHAWLLERVPAALLEYAEYRDLASPRSVIVIEPPWCLPIRFTVEDIQGELGYHPIHRFSCPNWARLVDDDDEPWIKYEDWEKYSDLETVLGAAQVLWRELAPQILAQWAHIEARNLAPPPTPIQPVAPEPVSTLERIADALEALVQQSATPAW